MRVVHSDGTASHSESGSYPTVSDGLSGVLREPVTWLFAAVGRGHPFRYEVLYMVGFGGRCGYSVAFGWPTCASVIHTVLVLSSMQYQIRPRVASSCRLESGGLFISLEIRATALPV